MSSHSYIANKKNDDIFININGSLIKRDQAKISVFDSGFLLGDGVWEGIRFHQSVLLFIEDHLNRLFESAKGISINIPFTKKEIFQEIKKTLSKNKMEDDIHIRLVISRGEKITPYQNPNANKGPINFVIIPEHKKSDPKIQKDGIKIGRVPNLRPNNEILSPQYNTLSKLNCILASIEANKLGFDEGIMNDLYGNISTCNSTNLFFIKDDNVITSSGKYCLNGITRKKAIELCHENSIECFEKNFTFEDIKDSDEAFVTGTFGGITPVSMLEEFKLNSTDKNSLTFTLKKLLDKKIENYIKENK
ncbi:MAG: aminotransferase class IV [Gammaproteobacteria bacterium]|nr:aminotransferase class IV [Gammaproteobacteria bacterium]|tara:strand:- start:251 stop:1165 length:915 start_codon:yes stop_codon:yes gene_type:complete